MKLHLDNPSGEYRINGYRQGGIVVNDVLHEGALVVRVNAEPQSWSAMSVATMTVESLAVALEPRPEVLLLGTGYRQQFPAGEVFSAMTQANIGLEVMDTRAACRTFNILAAEGREVVAALLPLD